MQISSWSRGRKILIGVLGGIGLSGLLTLLGFAAFRSVLTGAPAQTAAQTDAPTPTAKTWTLSVDYVPSTEAPAPLLTFRKDSAYPMPENALLPLGEDYPLGGTVYSNRKLTAVTVSISCSHNVQAPYPYRKTVNLSALETASYRLTDPIGGGASLSELVDFSELQVGVHTMKIIASCEGMKSVEIYRCRFSVAGEEWETIAKENFSDSHDDALKFFGDEKKFLYRYQWVNGRYILADPEWEAEYITSITGYPDESPWLVHVDAVPYFEKAFDYLNTTYLRVHGTNGDTGVIPAARLITEYNGCYVSRFTSSLKSISHHAFGTAVDVNASMTPNKNVAENKALIADDVKQHLVYNGLVSTDDVIYYDFTYDGTYGSDPNGVPQTCVNYLLYELAFFRAGFEWAHYYKSTSDAMHFCLSEFVTYSHDHKTEGLRKVFVYCEPMRLTEDQTAALPTASLPTPAPETPAPSKPPQTKQSGRPTGARP